MKPQAGQVPLNPAAALDTQTIDGVMDALLGAEPPPKVFALSETGLYIPLPPGLPIAPEQTITGIASGLELCLPAEIASVLEAWERVRAQRGSRVEIHLRRAPECRVTMHFCDARHRIGAYLCVVVGMHGSFADDGRKPDLFRPRVCTMVRNELSVIQSVDAAATQILGWTAQELVGKRAIDLVHPEDRAAAIANWMEMLARPGFEQRTLMRYRNRDGNDIWFEITHRNLLHDPVHPRVLTEMVDVSERMAAVEALRASELLLRRVTEALPIGIVQIDAARRIVYRNELLLEILGTKNVASLHEQFAGVARADRGLLEAALRTVLDRGEPAEVELKVGRRGGMRRCSVSICPLGTQSGDVSGAIICVTDVTERARLHAELERRAKYDTLTRCHNRASILEALEAVLAEPRRIKEGLAVLFVDLDRFKNINDRYGHAAGDELLRLSGERLLEAVRGGDIVGRFGGDEFLVVCPAVPSTEIALDIARRVGLTLSQEVTLGTASIAPTASIGVAWTDSVVACDAIVATADEAMYASKREACGPILALR